MGGRYACPVGPHHFGPGKLIDDCATLHYWSLHPGGAHFAYADGSVRFLSYSADAILPALSTRAAGDGNPAVAAPLLLRRRVRE